MLTTVSGMNRLSLSRGAIVVALCTFVAARAAEGAVASAFAAVAVFIAAVFAYLEGVRDGRNL